MERLRIDRRSDGVLLVVSLAIHRLLQTTMGAQQHRSSTHRDCVGGRSCTYSVYVCACLCVCLCD